MLQRGEVHKSPSLESLTVGAELGLSVVCAKKLAARKSCLREKVVCATAGRAARPLLVPYYMISDGRFASAALTSRDPTELPHSVQR
jgi:hypothetical protein